MSGIGIIGQALAAGISGAAEGMSEGIRNDMKQAGRLEEIQALRDADLMKQKAIERFKVDLAAEPAKRFGGLINQSSNEPVPLEAAPVTKTTSEGAHAVGLQDGLVGMTRDQVEAYQDPEMLAQYDKQMGEDKRLTEEKVAGKTRPRNQAEAIKEAIRKAESSGDIQAADAGNKYYAGTQSKADIEEKKLESREKIEQKRIEQRDRHDDKIAEAMMARIESASGGKAGNKTALIQNAEYLKSLGYSDDKIEKFIFEKKEIPLEDVAAKILAGDKFGEMTPAQAAQKAIALRDGLRKPAPKPMGTLPDGAKQVGTSGGKPVYQTPDGKKYIAN